jgi:hypothetical protein
VHSTDSSTLPTVSGSSCDGTSCAPGSFGSAGKSDMKDEYVHIRHIGPTFSSNKCRYPLSCLQEENSSVSELPY